MTMATRVLDGPAHGPRSRRTSLGERLPLESGHTRARIAFWGAAYAYLVAMLGTTVPTPLYELYEQRLDFGAGVLTVIFATYAVGVLIALLLFGPLSDRVGRRPVFAAALVAAALSTAVFLLAAEVGPLLLGRFISGLAAGLITGAAAAALTELEPAGDTERASRVSTAASIVGLGLGPLLAGTLAEYAPLPTRFPFIVYLCLLAPAFLAIWAMPETVTHPAPGPRFRARWPTVPRRVRPAFVIAAAAGFASFAILGFFTSLAPTFVGRELSVENHAVAGAVVFALFGASGAAQLLLHGLGDGRAMTSGLIAIPIGLLLIVLALHENSLALFIGGAVAGGGGSGLAFMGSLDLINQLASADQRAEAISAYFVVSYVAISVPVVGVGFAAQAWGLNAAALAFAIAIGALALLTNLLGGRHRTSNGRPTVASSLRTG